MDKWMGLPWGVQQLRLCAPNVGGPDLIRGQETRPCMPQLKILHTTPKTLHSQTCKQIERQINLK